jgi:hypothetical protein
VSFGEVIILQTRMEESESDKEIFITQNSFRESSTLDVGFDISSLLEPEDRLLIDKVLGVEENEVGLLERNDLREEPEQFGEQRQVVVISDEELWKRNVTRIRLIQRQAFHGQ